MIGMQVKYQEKKRNSRAEWCRIPHIGSRNKNEHRIGQMPGNLKKKKKKKKKKKEKDIYNSHLQASRGEGKQRGKLGLFVHQTANQRAR
jgi:hypothetical protein